MPFSAGLSLTHDRYTRGMRRSPHMDMEGAGDRRKERGNRAASRSRRTYHSHSTRHAQTMKASTQGRSCTCTGTARRVVCG